MNKVAVRNPITEEQAKAAVVPQKPLPPKMELDRTVMPKARDADLIMQSDGHRCARVEFWLRPGHTLEDALKPEFWSQVAYKFLRPIVTEGNYAGSIIDLRSHDLSMYAELLVRVVRKTGLVVELLRSHEIGLQNITSTTHTVAWNDKVKGFTITRNSDREIVGLAKDFPTKEQVHIYLERNG